MSCTRHMVIQGSIFLFLILLLALIKLIYKLWWIPTRFQKHMASQGVHGPSYTLIRGNTKEISNMMKDSMNKPISLSHDILPVVQPHIYQWIITYGQIYVQWHGAQPQLVISEPELCKEILVNKDGAYSKKKFQGYVKLLLGEGLGCADGEKWKKLRKVANHAFHGESLKSMVPEMIASAETMLEGWRNYEGKEIEVFDLFRFFTSEVISRTAFGSSYLEGEKIFENIMKLSVFLVKNVHTVRFLGLSKFVKTGDEIESEKIEKGIRDSISATIKKREEKVLMSQEDESFGDDFLGLLLGAHHSVNVKERISLDDLIDECKTFYFAGQETTNSMLAWTVFLLAHYTDWQDKAREEVLQIFGKKTPNSDGITKLKTMNMIMNESLRLYPPVLSIERRVNRKIKLGKITIPANVDVIIPTLALHHEPIFWGDDAQHFKPERFNEGVAKATNNNVGAFLPFGMGPRICAGFNFATNEAKIVMAMILQRYSFTLSAGYVHSPYQFHTIRPRHGVQVMLHPL